MSRRGVAFVAVAVTAAVALAFVLPREDGGLRVRTASDDAGATTTTDPATTTTTDSTTTTTQPASEFDEVVAEVSGFVEAERGLQFLRPVTVELADDEEFTSRLLDEFDEDRADIEAFGLTLKALGLIDADVDVVEAYRTLLGAGVVGFYDPATDELVVRGTDVTPYVRQVMAHELAHALDDQHFELERPDLEEADDERPFGFTSLVEGNAVRIEDAYVETFSAKELAEAFQEELELGSNPALFRVPIILIERLVAPYTLGPDLVAEILSAGGQRRLDAAFAEPPTTSEQVLEPDVYLAGEGPVAVGAPAADGDEVDRGVMGALGLQQLFAEDVGDDVAGEAVDGWGGDGYVTWRSGGDACVRLAVVGDTPADTDELRQAFVEWAGGDADVGAVSTGAFTVTSCRPAG